METNADAPKVVINCLDMSAPDLVSQVIEYLDNGIRVQIISLEKSDPSYEAKYTFIGHADEQEKPGIIISSYKPIENGCLIQID